MDCKFSDATFDGSVVVKREDERKQEIEKERLLLYPYTIQRSPPLLPPKMCRFGTSDHSDVNLYTLWLGFLCYEMTEKNLCSIMHWWCSISLERCSALYQNEVRFQENLFL